MLGNEDSVGEGFDAGSDDSTEITMCWFTVLLAAGNDTASKTVLAVGALRHCGRIETSAHTLRIVASEPGGNFQGFTL